LRAKKKFCTIVSFATLTPVSSPPVSAICDEIAAMPPAKFLNTGLRVGLLLQAEGYNFNIFFNPIISTSSKIYICPSFVFVGKLTRDL
jgi:hypothetical protein